MKRKVVVLMLALVLIVSMAVPAFAAEERGSTIPVMVVSLHAGPNHSYIVVENYTANALYIGGYSVERNEIITIGTFEGLPVYINKELNQISSYSNVVALSRYVYSDELDEVTTIVNAINNKIDSYGTYDFKTNNCVHFAMSVWNAIVPSSGRITFSFVWDDSLDDSENYAQYGLSNYNRFVSVISGKTAYYDSNPYIPSWQAGVSSVVAAY